MNMELARVKWSEEIGKMLDLLKPALPVKTIRELCETDRLWIYEVFFDKLSIGYFLTRDETLFDGTKELVITHCMTKVKGRTPLSSVLGCIIPNLAKERGFSSIRIHSERRGMDTILEHQGFTFFETVFTKRLD